MPLRPTTVPPAPQSAQEPQGEARALLDAATSEAQWQQTVIDAAVHGGWLAHHQKVPYRKLPDGRRIAITEPGTTKGVPDLLLVHEGRGEILHVELKTEQGALTREQRVWRDAIIRAGGRWFCWKPSQWNEACRVLGLPVE